MRSTPCPGTNYGKIALHISLFEYLMIIHAVVFYSEVKIKIIPLAILVDTVVIV